MTIREAIEKNWSECTSEKIALFEQVAPDTFRVESVDMCNEETGAPECRIVAEFVRTGKSSFVGKYWMAELKFAGVELYTNKAFYDIDTVRRLGVEKFRRRIDEGVNV